MQTNNKLYSFFIVLTLIFWNPLSYYLIYVKTEIFSGKIDLVFYTIYTVIFVLGLFFIYLIQKGRLKERLKNIVLSIAFLGIFFAILVGLDGLLGSILKKGNQPVLNKGLVFEPNTSARYKTREFDWIVNINNLGLRDGNISLDKKDKYRILCFGDSWTFGWGVDITDSWPKKLEKFLLSKGMKNIEVINCGRGGQYTSTYKQFMEKAVPLLKPDLVLVGVLQYDDLAQIYEENYFPKQKSKKSFLYSLAYVLPLYLNHSFSNILGILGSKKREIIQIQSTWKASANKIIENFTHLQKINFSTLEQSLQKMFINGELNPGLIGFYMNFPDRVAIFNDKNHPATQYASDKMNKDFHEMKSICDRNNSKLMFVNLPVSTFTGHKVFRTTIENSILVPYFENNNGIDEIYQSIAKNNGLSYIELTKHFKDLKDKSNYFFKYDGHPNEKGYEEIAKYIGKELMLIEFN